MGGKGVTGRVEGRAVQLGSPDFIAGLGVTVPPVLLEPLAEAALTPVAVAADGRLLLQSTGFDAPKEAGQAIAQLQKDSAALQTLAPRLAPVDGVDTAEVTAALQALAEAAAA